MQTTLTIPLATGLLHLELQPGQIPVRRLLGFAARVSSKRKFLLVSKVLGKHYPVSPKLMAWTYRALARKILNHNLMQGSVWLGMAETATGLGYGVYEAACREGLKTAVFIQTTRYHLDGVSKLAFEEAHSHATDFFLYLPEQALAQQQFITASSLVLIDDEISTGKTFLRLIKAYQTVNAQLQQVFIVSLVNFASADDRAFLEAHAGITVVWVMLREGQLHFDERHTNAFSDRVVNVSSNNHCKKAIMAWPGRLGITKPISLANNVLATLMPMLQSAPGNQRPLLVLGTGECNAPAFMLGRLLERAGYSVKVQSTTRSPIHLGNDITTLCQFKDNYQEGIPNFIYNMTPDAYQDIIICHETPLCPVLMERLQAWHALSARFELLEGSSKKQEDADATLHFYRP